MRVEIVQELESSDAKLEIPWASVADPEVRYIDLKKFPEQIARLEESRRFPSLGCLLRKIHAKGSGFRTAKCDAWTTTRLSADERLDFNLPYKVGGYLDLVFARAKLNSRLEPHAQLGRELEQLLRPCRVQAQVEIAVRRCLFHPKKRWGSYLTIFIHAYGATRSEPKKEWSRAVGCLGDALLQIGPTFGALPHHRAPRKPRASDSRLDP